MDKDLPHQREDVYHQCVSLKSTMYDSTNKPIIAIKKSSTNVGARR